MATADFQRFGGESKDSAAGRAFYGDHSDDSPGDVSSPMSAVCLRAHRGIGVPTSSPLPPLGSAGYVVKLTVIDVLRLVYMQSKLTGYGS